MELGKHLSPKSGALYAQKVDLTVEDDIKQAFKWILENVGPIHILINCAGIHNRDSFCEGKTFDWKNTFDTNVMALCITSREAISIMKENDIHGHIININSILGHMTLPGDVWNVYPATKFAVTALTETLRKEMFEMKIKIKVSVRCLMFY